MKAIINTVLVATALIPGILASAQEKKVVESIAIGSEIPMATQKMRSTDGKEVTLKGANKNGLIVMFSCNTCPYVLKSQARTKEIMAFAKEKGVGLVILNSNQGRRDKDDSFEAMKKYAKDQGYTAPYVVDEGSAVADAFGANRTPEIFLFDKAGKLVYKGAMEDNPNAPERSKEIYLKDAILKIQAGLTPDPAVTRSIGCSIKRSM
jgi:thioredoxin-related protein